MSLIATERDAQIMELNMRGFTIERALTFERDLRYFVTDGCSLVWDTPELAWSAAIFCAQHGWYPYGEACPVPQHADELIEAAVGCKRRR